MFLLFGFITFATVAAKAQHPAGEKIRSLEIGYLTKQLQLLPEEAEKFWPVFNKYKAEMKAVTSSEEVQEELDKQQKVLDIRRKYKKDFAGILNSNDRAQAVFDSEDRFKVLVKQEIQKRARAKQFRNNK